MENFKLIPLGKSGKFAIVDEEDYEWLMQWKWHLNGKGYAQRKQNKKAIPMHRVINKTPEGFDTDHINRNTIDNRKCNLRSVTRSQNNKNKGFYLNSAKNKSGYIGVYFLEGRQKWGAKGRRVQLGLFENKEEAIAARKAWELATNTDTST